MGSAIAELRHTPEARAGHTPLFPITETGFIVEGELYHISPLSISFWDINFTSFPGKCAGTLYSLLFWLSKWGYKNVKIDDHMDISPIHPQYYQLTIQQKQTLERQIKEGLAGVSQSITDFELLFHDLRKYNDYVQYFKAHEEALKEKDKEKREDKLERAEHSLKSLFIDFVDIHTGEGVALVRIAQRWPTIISDFMRLKEGDTNPKKIAKDYKVSEAEGVVLATKNKLYVEWRKSFEKTVRERYNRILGLTKSRKFSIDEYKRMLKPYIERYRSIKEVGPSAFKSLSWLRPGAQAASIDTVTIWSFKEMTPAEHGKPSFEHPGGSENILKISFPPSLRAAIKKNIKYLKDNERSRGELSDLKFAPAGIEPLDKWVWAFYYHIEDHYTKEFGFPVRFSLIDLIRARNEFINGWGNHAEPYYKVLDCDILRAIIRLPDGTELEDITYAPKFFLDSQNMLFLRYLEYKAQEKALSMYVDEMLGDTTRGKKIQELSGEFESLFGEVPNKSPSEKKEEISAAQNLRAYRDSVQKQVLREASEMRSPIKFIKKGHYEPSFDDRITGPWFTDIAESLALPVADFLKAKFDVPGVSMPGIK
jgi:hypothetical protein